MKSSIKKVLNKIMLRIFGHTPFPQRRSELRFTPIEIPQRNYSPCEFNRWAFVYQVSSLYNEKN